MLVLLLQECLIKDHKQNIVFGDVQNVVHYIKGNMADNFKISLRLLSRKLIMPFTLT